MFAPATRLPSRRTPQRHCKQLVEDAHHDVLKLRVHLFKGPAEYRMEFWLISRRAGRYAAGIGRLGRGKQHAVLLEQLR